PLVHELQRSRLHGIHPRLERRQPLHDLGDLVSLEGRRRRGHEAINRDGLEVLRRDRHLSVLRCGAHAQRIAVPAVIARHEAGVVRLVVIDVRVEVEGGLIDALSNLGRLVVELSLRHDDAPFRFLAVGVWLPDAQLDVTDEEAVLLDDSHRVDDELRVADNVDRLATALQVDRGEPLRSVDPEITRAPALVGHDGAVLDAALGLGVEIARRLPLPDAVLDVSSRLCDLVLSALGLELRRDLELLLGDGGSQPWLRDLVDARASLSSGTGLTLLDNLVSDQAPDVSLGRETHEPATRCRWG